MIIGILQSIGTVTVTLLEWCTGLRVCSRYQIPTQKYGSHPQLTMLLSMGVPIYEYLSSPRLEILLTPMLKDGYIGPARTYRGVWSQMEWQTALIFRTLILSLASLPSTSEISKYGDDSNILWDALASIKSTTLLDLVLHPTLHIHLRITTTNGLGTGRLGNPAAWQPASRS